MFSSIIFYISISITLSIIGFLAIVFITHSVLKKQINDKFNFIKDKNGKIIDYENKKKTSIFIDGEPLYKHTQVACLDLCGISKEEQKTEASRLDNYKNWQIKRYKIADRCIIEDNNSTFKTLFSKKINKLIEQRWQEKDNKKKFQINNEIQSLAKKEIEEDKNYLETKENEYKKIVDNFIEKVKEDKNIKVIKLNLRSHGSKEGLLQISPYYVKYFLQKIKDENIKLPIYVKNTACYQANIAEKTSSNGIEYSIIGLDIKQYLFDFAKDNNIELFYSEHENQKTSFIEITNSLNFEKNNVFKVTKIDTLTHHHLFRDKNNNFHHDLYDKKDKHIFKSLLDNLVDLNDVQKIDKVLQK